MIRVYDRVYVPEEIVGVCIGVGLATSEKRFVIVESDDGERVELHAEDVVKLQPSEHPCRQCYHPWRTHEKNPGNVEDVNGRVHSSECIASTGMGDWCGCEERVPESVVLWDGS